MKSKVKKLSAVSTFVLLTLVSITSIASFRVTLHGNELGRGGTRDDACEMATESHDNWCPGVVLGPTSGRWYCKFRYTLPGVTCTPCTGFFCNFSLADIWGAECVKPRVYDPITLDCEDPLPVECDKTERPVHFATGNKSIFEKDFSASSRNGLRFSRHWQSQIEKWQFSYRQNLVETVGTANYITIVRDTGWPVRFATKDGVWIGQTMVKDTLERDGDEWVYTLSSGDREWFDSSGRLIRILRVDGSGVTVTYPTTTSIQITDDFGNHIDLSLDGDNRVIAMTDPDLQTYRYAYNIFGNLEYVSYPDESPGVEGSNPFSENNPFRQYHYADSTNTNLITAITGEDGDLYKTISYNDDSLVVTSGLFDGSIGGSTIDYSQIDDISDATVTVENSLGKKAIYHLKTLFGVAKVVQVDGAAQPSTGCLADVHRREYYAENGWLKRKIDKAGNQQYYEYYSDTARYGLLKKRIEAEATTEERVFEFDWYPDSRQIKREMLIGTRQTDYSYYSNGKLHSRTETDLTGLAHLASRTWTHTYVYHDPGEDTQVATVTVDGPRNDANDFATHKYSRQGYMTEFTNAKGQVTQYLDHNGRGQPRAVIDPNDVVTKLTYTPRGRLKTITQDWGADDQINALTVLHYDDVGQLTGIALADGVNLDFEFDEGRRMDAIQNGLGEKIDYSLDAAGNRSAVRFKNGEGEVTQLVSRNFDGLSRLYEEFGSDGQKITYIYDEKDHLSAIYDGINAETTLGFDALNRLSKVTDADYSDLLIEHDSRDIVDKVTDQRGLVTNYLYDGFGDLKELSSPDTGVASHRFDEAGNLTRTIDARGVTSLQVYDELNRLTAVSYPANASKNQVYYYDNAGFCGFCEGRLNAIQDSSGTTFYFYDALGRITYRHNVVQLDGSEGSVALTTAFSWNKAGRLKSIQYPNGQLVKYEYDAAGQVDSVHYVDDKPQTPELDERRVIHAIKYQPYGPMKQATYGNNLQLNREYDLDGRLRTQSVGGVQNLDYEYDVLNNIEAINNQLDNSRDEVYTYDNLNRLDSASGKYGDIDYLYDEVGNREKRTIVRGATAVVEDHIIAPNSNQLDQIDISDGTSNSTREFDYDAAGNLIMEKRADGTYKKPVYDETSRMESISQ